MRLGVLIKTLFFIIGIGTVIYCIVKLILIYIQVHLNSKFYLEKYKNINYFPYTNDSINYLPRNFLPETDYNQLIDINFYFTNISFPCNTGPRPLLLVLVHTSPTNYAKRKTIRETWGRNEDDVKVLFAMGSVTTKGIKHDVDVENSIHNDIIQGNFLDSYRNLTYKHAMVFKYVIYHCPLVKYVLKTDDDIFVNMPLMKNFLRTDLSPFGVQNLLMCYVIYNARVIRTYRSKWRVSFKAYPDKRYPTYCLGWAVIYSPDIIFNLYKETQRTEYFWVDDAHVTGIVANKINFYDHINIMSLMLTRSQVKSINNATQKYRPFLFGNADMQENEIRNLWNYVVNSPVPKSIREEEILKV